LKDDLSNELTYERMMALLGAAYGGAKPSTASITDKSSDDIIDELF